MTLNIWTARIGRATDDALDITRKSGCATGIVCAPSWSIPRPRLARRRAAVESHEARGRYEAEWPDYVDAYTREMRRSYVLHRPVWDELLTRRRVVFCCYRATPRSCHRTVLAEIFFKLGASFWGEYDSRK